MSRFRQIFFTGLVTLLPIAITIYILYAGIRIVENVLGSVLREVLTDQYYIPGIGLLATLTLIFLFGLLLNNLIIKSFLSSIENKFTSVPLIKAVYSPLRDLMNLFSRKGQRGIQSVVFVQLSEGINAMGLVTRESFRDLKELQSHTQDRVAVYIPMSYGLGGFTLLIAKHKITPIDLPIEKAMSLAITGWVKAQQEEPNGRQP